MTTCAHASTTTFYAGTGFGRFKQTFCADCGKEIPEEAGSSISAQEQMQADKERVLKAHPNAQSRQREDGTWEIIVPRAGEG